MSDVELREAPGGKLKLEGHVIVWGVWYNAGGFEERIMAGSMRRALKDPNLNTVLLVNHGGLPLSRTQGLNGKAPTLRLSETARGLFVDADLDSRNPRAQELHSVTQWTGLGMSVGMHVFDDEWVEGDRSLKRTCTQISTHDADVSAVTFPASTTTDAMVNERGSLSMTETRDLLRNTVERRYAPEAFDLRSDYAAHELAKLGAEGMAFSNLDGHWSFPTKDRADFDKAVKMVQLSGASQSAVRAYLIKRAKAEGWPIPITWQGERSASCARCEGRGVVELPCPTCNPSDTPSASSVADGRSALDGTSFSRYRTRATEMRSDEQRRLRRARERREAA